MKKSSPNQTVEGNVRSDMKYLLTTLLFLAVSDVCAANTSPDPYDKLYDAIMVRKTADGRIVALDATTPMLWQNSQYLLGDGNEARLLEALDAFNSLSPEEIEAYPALNRALLQYHVWTVFDWTTTLGGSGRMRPSHRPSSDVIELQKSLVRAIKRLALSDAEIAGLPNPLEKTIASRTYAERCNAEDANAPFLPRDILPKDSPWVCLTKTEHAVPAKLHTESVGSRSVFLIFLRLPDGRKATLDYLQMLAAFRSPWVPGEQEPSVNIPPHAAMRELDFHVNPLTPQFPVGTQVALVKQALLINESGALVLSPLVQTVQLRTYLNVSLSRAHINPALPQSQALAEFVLQPRKMMTGMTPMRAVAVDEILHTTTFTSGDPIENPRANNEGNLPRLSSRMTCHPGSGIHSINSYGEFFSDQKFAPSPLRGEHSCHDRCRHFRAETQRFFVGASARAME